jgi:uncharacterized membrane protein YgdD (TMEM256/DUF423 family)
MAKVIIALGAVFGFLSVGLGAFGAHALKARLEPRMLEVFETGCRYQMYHALGLILVGLLVHLKPTAGFEPAAWAMMSGIVLFSFSLYALALSGIKVLGAITPLGGVAFLIGWGLLAWRAWQTL